MRMSTMIFMVHIDEQGRAIGMCECQPGTCRVQIWIPTD